MTTFGNELPEPDPEVIENGTIACVVKGTPYAIESWVQNIAQKTGARVDWYYYTENKEAKILHLGDAASFRDVLNEIKASKIKLIGEVIFIQPFVQ
jgi:hypothetical protein